jgi:hypothetical protein
MKTLNLLAVCSLVLFSFSACEKEDLSKSITPPNSTTTLAEAAPEQTKAASPAWGVCCVYNGVDGCTSPKVNCFDDVEIGPKTAAPFTNFEIALANGNVQGWFNSADRLALFPSLRGRYLGALLSGNMTLVEVATSRVDKKFYKAVNAGQGDNQNTGNEFILQVTL